MGRPDATGTWITLILLALSLCFFTFGGIESARAVEAGAVFTQSTLPFIMLNTYLGPLDNILSALSSIFNDTPVAPAAPAAPAPPAPSPESNQTVSDKNKVQEKEAGYSVLVHIDNSNLLVEDDKGNVISKRKAGSDDAGAIREAINKTGRGTILCIGTFHILSSIDNLGGDITLKGSPGKTVFDCSKMKDAVFPCHCEGLGYAEYTTPLLNDVHEGSDTIMVKDAKPYREGDFVKLIDNENIIGFKKGEILRIEKINGNKITFDGATRDDYTVKNAANIRKLTMTKYITVDGIKFIGPGIETNVVLFSLSLLDHFRFANNTVSNFGRAAIYLSDSLDSVIENNIFENIYMTGFGYSISVSNACNNVYIIDNVFRVKGRHYITAGAGTGSRNSGGFARNIKVINNSFEDSDLEAINSHPPFMGPIDIIRNNFKSCGKGITIVNGDTVIVDNNFTKCGIGIQLLGDEKRTHDVRSNEFNGCRESMEIETSNMTIYGNIGNIRIRIDRSKLEFL